MTVSKFPILLLSLVALTSGARLSASEPTAPEGEKLTLQAAIAEAVAQSPALRVIEADIDSARGEVLTAQTRPNPELTFAPRFHRIGEGGSEFNGAVELNQLFLFPGKRELLVSIAERNVELRRLGIEALRFQLSAAVRKVFYELLAAQSILDLRRQQLDSARTFQQAAARRAQSGYASDFEAVKSQGEVINAQKLLSAAEGQIAVGRVELSTLLGREPSVSLEVSGSLDVVLPERRLPELLALAYASNPSIRAQEMQAEVAGLNVRRARLARKPDFTVGPALELSKSEQFLGVGVTAALPRKNYGRGEILTASAEQRKALAEMERLRREIAGAVTKSATQLATARVQLALYSQGYLDQLKTVVAQAEQSYAQNVTSLLIYLDAKRTYFDTLAGYYGAIADVATSRAELESAVGVPLSSPVTTSNP
jgi:cobalt-zinc-cadmium efflux system outer membrane protein